MLFVETQTLSHKIDRERRIQLLEELQRKNLNPLIRSARLNCFGNVLLDPDRIPELETAIAKAVETENQETYVRGDVFCLSDHVFFLLFDDENKPAPLLRAGIVYSTRTTEPFRKLHSFSQDVESALFATNELSPEAHNHEGRAQWLYGKPTMPEGFKRFVARQDTDSLFTSSRKETMTKRLFATSILEDPSARIFLRRAKDAHVEGYASKLLTGDTTGSSASSIGRLEDAGLVEREVQVSCRKTGHALFRLPTPHALAVVTVSDATCSECGSAVADERVEEVISPTRLATSLLEDGTWLISRLHNILRELGIPESEIAVGPSEGEGYGQMIANISGQSFLVVARDGELTPAFARWAIDLEVETEASHLVVVATGRIHNQAALLLHNHARHRIRAGQNFELIVADEAAVASQELRAAFERVSQSVVDEHLCRLDGGLGLSLSKLISTKFRFLDEAEVGTHPSVSDMADAGTDHYKEPLSLAAHASASSGQVIDVEKLVTSEREEGITGESDAAVSATLNSESQTAENIVN